MAVLEEKNILFNIIQKVIPKIVEDEQERINQKWIFDLKEKDDKIKFTKDELDYIKENPTIKIAGDSFWPAYS